jgi:perosamine synthetase
MRAIPPFRYSFTDADADFVAREVAALLRDRELLTMGRHGRTLEEEFRAYTGTRHAAAVASGTAALELILRAVDVAGAEVIVPTNTFGATPVAVLRAGGTPVFADCLDDLSIDPEDVRRRLSPRVRAVVTVHIGGLISPGTLELQRVCAEHGVALVEDAAHAAGASLGGVKAGGFGVGAAFSFFSTKVMTSGEGGMVATNDDRVHDTALLLRDHAKDPDGAMDVVGYNWRLTEMQALLALAQLRRLDEMIAGRARVARAYDEALAGCGSAHVAPVPEGAVHNRYKYVVFLSRHSPAEVRERLAREHGVALGGTVYAIPCHRQPAFAPYADARYPAAERLCGAHLCPPIYPDLSDDDACYAARSLRAVLDR